ncbi:MAG: tetratricopeptide repeat protein [Acidobacteria bacterium]|nr:tetratricopeptide repeat protein [Acidobacteriota bacterium]
MLGRWAPATISQPQKDGSFVDNATNRSFKKQDQFLELTNTGASWAEENRQKAIVTGVIAVVLILVLVGGYTLFQSRSNAADTAFGAAMETYQTPLANAAQPTPPGMKTFPDSKARAAAANAEFKQVADKYGWTTSGKLAEYFVGLTYTDEGQTGPAHEALEKVAGSWSRGISALGKSALAALDAQSGQNAQAVDLYDQLAKGNATTVPPALAQLQLAELYQSEGNTDKARQIFAEVKDKDKDAKGKPGAASEIANEKLNPRPTSAPGLSPQ